LRCSRRGGRSLIPPYMHLDITWVQRRAASGLNRTPLRA
jgi:hypothetical protein